MRNHSHKTGWFKGLAILGGLLVIGLWGFHFPLKSVHAVSGRITGTVETSGHLVVTDGTVCAYPSANFSFYENQCGSLAALGAFSITVNQAATYTVTIYANATDDVSPMPATVVFTGADVALGVIHLEPPSVKGKVYFNGSPVNMASVSIHTAAYSSTAGEFTSATTDSSGIFKGGVLNSGSYFIDIIPSPMTNAGILPTRNLAVTVNYGSTNTSNFDTPISMVAAKKTITGTVTKPDGTAVTDATISAFSINAANGASQANVDGSGNFTMLMGAGKYQVMVMSQMGGSQPSWGYFDSPVTVSFSQADTVVESQTVNFQVTNLSSTITGRAIFPDGTPLGMSDGGIGASVAGGYGANMTTNFGSNGAFSLKVAPNYTYQLNLWNSNQLYGAPDIATVTIGDGETKDIGTITLQSKTAVISGTVTDSNGAVIANQWVNAWRPTGSGWSNAQTDASGNFTLRATAGVWFVDCMGGVDMSGGATKKYIKTQAPQRLVVADNETKANTNFSLALADATIRGTVQDASNNIISINTFAFANDVNRSVSTSGIMSGYSDLGGSVSNGVFAVQVPAGTYQLGVMMPPGSSYTPSTTTTITVAAGETKTGQIITVLPNNATISGTVVDTNGTALTTVGGEVFADNGAGGHQWTPFENGSYTLNVAAGDWRIGYMVNPASGYTNGKLGSSKITVAAGQTVTNNITLAKADSTITVNVIDPNGQPIKNAWVSADIGLAGRQGSADQVSMYGSMFNQGNTTNASGTATITVPAGTYFVGASLPSDQGYIFPQAQRVAVSASSPASITLRFRTSNATLTGTMTLSGSANSGYVSAWSEDGAFSETTTTTGAYTLNVVKNQNWHVSASYETTASFYRSSEYNVPMPSTTASQDLPLVQSDVTLSPPETATFDAATAKIMTLMDGTKLDMPAYSVAVSGNVTVTATPKVQGVPTTASAKPLALAYDLVAKDSNNRNISTFQSNVTITLPFTHSQLSALGITEDDISPMYYDTTSGSWKTVDNVVVDKDNNVISFTASHFTSFALTTGKVNAAALSALSITVTSPAEGTTVNSSSTSLVGMVSNAGATLTYSLNGGISQSITVDSAGAFTHTISNLLIGTNTIVFSAVNGLDSTSLTRTVVYSLPVIPPTVPSVQPTVASPSQKYTLLIAPQKGIVSPVRIFNSVYKQTASFYPYGKKFKGGIGAISADVNGDYIDEIITIQSSGTKPALKVLTAAGKLLATKTVTTSKYANSYMLTNGDVDSDGLNEVILAANGKAPSQVVIYSYANSRLTQDKAFNPYAKTYAGGVTVALGDVDGDSKVEIVTAPNRGLVPEIGIFNNLGKREKKFNAYSSKDRNGVSVTLGDVNKDGVSEIITVPGKGSKSNVIIYTYKGKKLTSWYAVSKSYRLGVTTRTIDIDADGTMEIVAMSLAGDQPGVYIYSWKGKLEKKFLALSKKFKGGVQAEIKDINDDLTYEIVTAGRSGSSQINIFNYKGKKLKSFYPYGAKYKGGINISLGLQ